MRTEALIFQLREAAFKFRGHCGQIAAMLKQPVPFPYFHLLNLMLVINLILLSYAIVQVRASASRCLWRCIQMCCRPASLS